MDVDVDSTTGWWRDQARAEMGSRYAEHTATADAGWEAIAASGAEDMARMASTFRHGTDLDVLEIGCGVGRLTSSLAQLFRSVLAVDIAEDVVAEAAANCRAPNVEFGVIDGVRLLSGQGSFDVVFSAETFHHIQPRVFRQYLKDSFRLLRAGGQVALHVNVEPNTARARVGQRIRGLLWLAGVSSWRGWPTHPGFRRQHYRRRDVLGMMSAAGFVDPRSVGSNDRQIMFVAEKPG